MSAADGRTADLQVALILVVLAVAGFVYAYLFDRRHPETTIILHACKCSHAWDEHSEIDDRCSHRACGCIAYRPASNGRGETVTLASSRRHPGARPENGRRKGTGPDACRAATGESAGVTVFDLRTRRTS